MLDRHVRTDSVPVRITDDPSFQALVRERTRFGWLLSALMLGVYLVFIGLAAFGKGVMSSTVGDSSISWGVAYGLFVILFAFAITGVYVARANSRFDQLTARIDRGAR